MTKLDVGNHETQDKKQADDAGALSRRELLGIAGPAAVAGVLVACGGTEPSPDMGKTNKDMRGVPDMGGPVDMTPGPCMPKVAVGAELLNVNEAKHFYNSGVPKQSFFVARDSKGWFARNDVCNHNQCQAGYNAVAKTYDCPCHGSRFNLDGTLLNGPATAALKSFPMKRRTDGMLEVDCCVAGSTDLTGRVT